MRAEWVALACLVACTHAAIGPLALSATACSPRSAGKLLSVLCSAGASGCSGRLGELRLRGGGNTLGVDGEAITEEQAGEELIKAANSGDVHGLEPAGIDYLIQAGAPVNYQDMWRRTPLHYAAREGHVTAVKRLVELGADMAAEDFLARTPLHMAARKGHVVAMEALIQLGSDIDHPDKNPWPNNGGRTPLHWACYKGHADIVAKLCELGANKEAQDNMKRTALHWAARRGNLDCVQVLLVMGANVHAVDQKSLKPLNLANSKESNSATQALLHAATIRGKIPDTMPTIVSRPVPEPVIRDPPKGQKKTAPPPRKAPAPSAAKAPPGKAPVRGKQEVPSLQDAIANAKAKTKGRAPSAAAAAMDSQPPAASSGAADPWGETASGGERGDTGLDQAVARARARLAQQNDEGAWDVDAGEFPTGVAVDTKAEGDGWGDDGKNEGYAYKAEGVEDDGTRFVREKAREWTDDAADEEESVEYA